VKAGILLVYLSQFSIQVKPGMALTPKAMNITIIKQTLIYSFIILTLGCSTKSNDPNRPLSPPSGFMNETFVKIFYVLPRLSD